MYGCNMFMILNRHKEILANDGEFYPNQSVIKYGIRLFPSEEVAVLHAKTIRDYTKVAQYQLDEVIRRG